MNKNRRILISYPDIESSCKTEGILHLLTYNVAGLPEGISSAKTKRYESMLMIGEKCSIYDIVNVQEDFNYNIQLYSNASHVYKSAHRGKAMWGDGLNTLSRYPILEFRRIAWSKCNGSDCLTPKGFSLARMRIAKDVEIDVYNVHATAANTVSASKARQRNLLQLADYIKNESKDYPVIVMGDFNAHYQYELDNMFEFLKITDLKDSWVEIIQKGKYPDVVKNFEFMNDLECTDDVESIDKVLFRDSKSIKFEPLIFKVELDRFLNLEHMHLSDHLPIHVDIKWSLNK